MSDGLGDLFDDFDQEVEKQPRRERPPRQPAQSTGRNYRSALDERRTNRRDIAKATGKKASVAGQYVRRSFTFRPDQLESIEHLAGQLGLSQNDLVRWFTDMGIELVEQGERPPVAEEVRHRYDPDSL
jgi:hypothetical protein